MNDRDDIELPDDHVLVESLDKGAVVIAPDGSQTPLAEFRERSMSWLDADPAIVRDAIERRHENRQQIINWIRDNLKEGDDYGRVQTKRGPSKPSLWKSGAEKIAGMLGLQCHWPDLDKELDRLRDGSEVVFISCELLRDGAVHAAGAGARAVRQDGGDWNKAIKMAKKSAMIDAVLNVAGVSEVFTQDVAPDKDEDQPPPLDEKQIADLYAVAEEHYGDRANDVLRAMALRYYQLGTDDWHQIPGWRFDDAVRNLRERAGGES